MARGGARGVGRPHREAAFKGYPHAGDIVIKQKGHEIDGGVVDFKLASAKVDSAAATFAKLVLSRL